MYDVVKEAERVLDRQSYNPDTTVDPYQLIAELVKESKARAKHVKLLIKTRDEEGTRV